MKSRKDRIKALLNTIQSGIYEKEAETSMGLLAAIAGESILLLGPPGVAKSMIARRLKYAFKDARSFEYLMSRFSTPDEIFGPVSIARLKENDSYERTIDGFLPSADVVFLDEIWKAGPAIQNTLLTAMNERLFRNGDKEIKLPLKLLIGASNELPAKGEGLEALWDRFIIRLVCRPIENDLTFQSMLVSNQSESTDGNSLETSVPFTEEEYHQWQSEIKTVTLSPELLQAVVSIRHSLANVTTEESELSRSIYVSDRRWTHIAWLAKTSAYIQDRSTATPADLFPLTACLWNEPDEIPAVRKIVIKTIFAPFADRLNRLAASVKNEIRTRRAKDALARAARENDHRDENLAIVDKLFYHVENHGNGHTYIFITDFKRMPIHSNTSGPAKGIIYKDGAGSGKQIIRLFNPILMTEPTGTDSEKVTLCRDNNNIFINGVAFKMRRRGNAVMSPADGKIGGLFASSESNDKSVDDTALQNLNHYEDDIEQICTDLDTMKDELLANIFISTTDAADLNNEVQRLYKEIALCRVDIRKLLYDE